MATRVSLKWRWKVQVGKAIIWWLITNFYVLEMCRKLESEVNWCYLVEIQVSVPRWGIGLVINIMCWFDRSSRHVGELCVFNYHILSDLPYSQLKRTYIYYDGNSTIDIYLFAVSTLVIPRVWIAVTLVLCDQWCLEHSERFPELLISQTDIL